MFWTSCKCFLTLTLLTGFIYPLLMTIIGYWTMPEQAMGSLIKVDNQIRGSLLIGQSFQMPYYFWSRPSAFDYNPIESGGSNLGPTNKKLQMIAKKRAEKLATIHNQPIHNIPSDLIYASGSGLDPHISLESVQFQFDRVSHARQLSQESQNRLQEIILHLTMKKSGGSYLNVLLLNQELDKEFPLNTISRK